MRQSRFDVVEEPVLSVSELLLLLRETLDETFGDLWVEGEIGSLHRSRRGHLYFDLKDENGQLRGVVFRGNASGISFDPEEGLSVRAHGRLDIYPDRGSLQLVIDELRPWGEGAETVERAVGVGITTNEGRN